MKELDRIYEEIERLLEAQVPIDREIKNELAVAGNTLKSNPEDEEGLAALNAALLKAKEYAKSFITEGSGWTPVGLTNKCVPIYTGKDENGNDIMARLFSGDGGATKYIKPYDVNELKSAPSIVDSWKFPADPTPEPEPEPESEPEPVVEEDETEEDETAPVNNPNLNNNININNRFNDVIDNPQIQNEVSKASGPISGIEIKQDTTDNQQKIFFIYENIKSPIELPDFIKKFMEAKEIPTLNAGASTSLNPYFSKEIRDSLAAKGIEITKVLLSTDGQVLFLDKRGVQIMVDKPEEHQGENAKEKSISDSAAISKPVTLTELVELEKKINNNLNAGTTFKNIEKKLIDTINKLFGNEAGKNSTLSAFKVGNYIEGTVLNEAKPIETTEKDKEKDKEKEDKKETPKVKGNCEVYINGEFSFNLPVSATNENTNLEKSITEIIKEIQRGVVSELNSSIIELVTKTKNENTFTGNQKQRTKFNFLPGNEQRIKFNIQEKKEETEGTEENKPTTIICTIQFTIIIKKDNPKDTFGTKFNKVLQGVTGVADMANRLALNGKNSMPMGKMSL